MRFLNHPKFPQHRNNILNAHPELKKNIIHTNIDKKLLIERYIDNYYLQNNDIISILSERLQNEVENIASCLTENLAQLMDYSWPPNHPGYTVSPTILPFCPFEGNTFYYSIVYDINHNNIDGKLDITFVAIHEISHFIFYDILEKHYEPTALQKLDDTIVHFMQEIIAPVVMNQPSISEKLDMTDYLGNPNFKHIYIVSDKDKINISLYFQKMYEDICVHGKKNFTIFLDTMLGELQLIESIILEKHSMWNKYGKDLYEDADLLREYSEPIKIPSKK